MDAPLELEKPSYLVLVTRQSKPRTTDNTTPTRTNTCANLYWWSTSPWTRYSTCTHTSPSSLQEPPCSTLLPHETTIFAFVLAVLDVATTLETPTAPASTSPPSFSRLNHHGCTIVARHRAPRNSLRMHSSIIVSRTQHLRRFHYHRVNHPNLRATTHGSQTLMERERERLLWHVAASHWIIKESRLVIQETLGKGGSMLVK